jgi:hypothetical protein
MSRTTIAIHRLALVIVACAGMSHSASAVEPRGAGADAGRAPDRGPIAPDPLAGSARIAPQATGRDVAALEAMLPPRTDSPADWQAGLEPLHFCGEPRLLSPCIPPPPCHPSRPPRPLDLVGVRGAPTCGPIYGGPCSPRTGTHDAGPLPRVHRLHDRGFDWFYRTR